MLMPDITAAILLLLAVEGDPAFARHPQRWMPVMTASGKRQAASRELRAALQSNGPSDGRPMAKA
jgi:hypothetical protein